MTRRGKNQDMFGQFAGSRQKTRRSLVSRLLTNPLIFDLLLAVTIVLAFALYQEAPPGTWTHIRRILTQW